MHFKGPVLILSLSRTQIPTTRVGSRYKIKTDPAEFYGVGLDWLLLTIKPQAREENDYVFSSMCTRAYNWESTNFNLIPRGFSATFRLRARIFSSFQLL